jgi:hypothetical protein
MTDGEAKAPGSFRLNPEHRLFESTVNNWNGQPAGSWRLRHSFQGFINAV